MGLSPWLDKYEMSGRCSMSPKFGGGVRLSLGRSVLWGSMSGSLCTFVLLKVLIDKATALKTEPLRFEQDSTYVPIHMAGHEGLGHFVFVPTGKQS